ncbi:hypothetical protein I350_06703 [Cryptococcus amylolentus CBS 6273]|uniref:Uncharacterized protein n=1 Tax=Cryptococcus amylolentus CBS 6273 TaxID=1296118 RepID=A0A1E3JGX7_9TREE|nr:hypothetical protein I350_06703 [Cryptococcus amylolentus CBS 6273]
MSGVKTILIPCAPINTPHLPTGTTEIPIAPLGLVSGHPILWFYAFEGALDEARLVRAIGLLTSVWPTLAGRYQREVGGNGEVAFSIRLCASPIPFETQSIERDHAFPDKRFIQPAEDNPYIPTLPVNFRTLNSESHLFSVSLTTLLPSGKSVLGFQMSHLAQDSESGVRVLLLLEALYLRGQDALESIPPNAAYALPTFFPDVGPLPVYVPSQNQGEIVPSQPSAAALQAYLDAKKDLSMVFVQLSMWEVKILKAQYRQDVGFYLSDQDVISTWWIDLLRRVGVDVPIVIYVLNVISEMVYRLPSFPPSLPTLSGTASLTRPIDISSQTSPARVATAIREHVVQLRSSPDKVLEWISDGAYHFRQAAVEGKTPALMPEGQVKINSSIRSYWPLFGFGEHEVSYHTSFTAPRVLRVFLANPAKQGEARGEKLELYFDVNKEDVEKVERLVERDKAGWKMKAAGMPRARL